MGTKLIWTGMLFILAFPLFGLMTTFSFAGAIIFTIGVILLWMDK